MKTCSKSSDEFHKCLASALEGSLLVLKDGNKEFDMEPLDPFHIDYIESDSLGGSQSNFYLKSAFKNIDLNSFSTGKVLRVSTKFDKKFAIRAETFIENFSVIGDYKMTGKLILPLNGEGKCNITMQNVTSVFTARGSYFDKNSETYLNITSISFKLIPSHVSYYFENLFKNDKTLSDTINNFMNENWKLVADNLLPSYEVKFGEIFVFLANKIFHNVPTNRIFLD
jgi:hypothetical protein